MLAELIDEEAQAATARRAAELKDFQSNSSQVFVIRNIQIYKKNLTI